MAQRLIDEYLEAAGHRYDQKGPLFRPVKNNISDTLDKSLDPHAVYTCIIPQIRKRNRYHGQLGRVQDYLGHLNIQYTVIYTASKLVELPLKIDFAKDKALLACIFALLFQVANREFFLDLEVRFFGTAMCISFYIILF